MRVFSPFRWLLTFGVVLLLVQVTCVTSVLLPESIFLSVRQSAHSQFRFHSASVKLIEEGIGTTNLPDFWEVVKALGDLVKNYTDDILQDAAQMSEVVGEKITDFKESMGNVISGSAALKDTVLDAAEKNQINLDGVSAKVSDELMRVLEGLKAEFPPSDEADHHEQRVEMVSVALDRIEDALVRTFRQLGLQEAEVRPRLRDIKRHLRNVLVVTGDLGEQHPVLLEILLFSGATMLMPEYWLLRPMLSFFGFGPQGPVKGSAAAWAQRRFFGAVVPEGSWFSRLQSAGMKFKDRIPADFWKTIFGGIGFGLSIIGSILKRSCGR